LYGGPGSEEPACLGQLLPQAATEEAARLLTVVVSGLITQQMANQRVRQQWERGGPRDNKAASLSVAHIVQGRETVHTFHMGYYLLEYALIDDYLARRAAFRDEHLALAREAHRRGDLILAGALAEPPDRAVLVWRTDDRSVVERFIDGDPYVRNGLVTSWTIRPWTVVIGEAAGLS
jgi:uncharacterized protein YciI